ncbi:predicted protein [Chaetomium globosum CBS 148.51]|uniref:Uncharacterized protein n=1 Tax=Chaetomium globosum (strain ATCC 6205 / CBS 148.51 / DSM 1962 / NBRC 6347 / NRRL 1970) TaxID=306901 RepID=Q2H6P1_CHAGB|nr:uncharacterized protein CHGG_05674 [Chaetomium globosum CBS 148.51]EAQ89055.1 predicted protein [Chaetomium globosum CBS 148.51]
MHLVYTPQIRDSITGSSSPPALGVDNSDTPSRDTICMERREKDRTAPLRIDLSSATTVTPSSRMARWLIAPPESSVGRRKLRAWGGSVRARSDSSSPRRADYLMCTVLVGGRETTWRPNGDAAHLVESWGRACPHGTAQPRAFRRYRSSLGRRVALTAGVLSSVQASGGSMSRSISTCGLLFSSSRKNDDTETYCEIGNLGRNLSGKGITQQHPTQPAHHDDWEIASTFWDAKVDG